MDVRKKGDAMALKSLKKTLVYSSESSKELIETMINDEASVTKLNGSSVMENYILDGLLTNNQTISHWIKSLYIADWSTGKIISSVCEFNSAGINWKSRELNLMPIIEFAIKEQIYIEPCTVDKNEIYYILNQLDSICKKFSELEDDNLDIESKAKYKEAQQFVKRLIDKSQSQYDPIPFSDFYRLIKLYWEELKSWTIPFRMLSCIADIQTGWRNTSESRVELVKLLKDLAKTWPENI